MTCIVIYVHITHVPKVGIFNESGGNVVASFFLLHEFWSENIVSLYWVAVLSLKLQSSVSQYVVNCGNINQLMILPRVS